MPEATPHLPTPGPATGASRRPARRGVSAGAAAALDAGSVVLFAALGRASHEHGLSPVGIAQTAAPFLAGAALGWAAASGLRRRPPTDLAGGAIVWGGTLVGGMAIRAATGGGVAPSFVVVAGTVTAAMLLGWRAVARGRSTD